MSALPAAAPLALPVHLQGLALGLGHGVAAGRAAAAAWRAAAMRLHRAAAAPAAITALAVLAVLAVLAAPLSATAQTAPAGPADAGAIRIGVLAVLDDHDTQRQWQALHDGLATALPGRRLQVEALDPSAMQAALAAGTLAFVLTNPGHYVVLESRHRVTRIATQTVAEGGDAAHAVGSAVVVPAQSPLARRAVAEGLAALRGQRVAAVSGQAFGGWQLVAAQWVGLGIDAEAGDVRPVFTGYPMTRVLQALQQGRADAAVLRTCLLERWQREGRIAAGALRVVGAQPDSRLPCQSSTPLYPGWAFAAAPAVPPELARQVAVALLTLPPDAAGTRWSVPADYQRVHDVLRTLEVEPYAFLRANRLDALARRYWFVLGGVLALLALGAAYMLRVEALVRRRTAELSRSLGERDRLARELEREHEALDHLGRLSILGELSATLGHELNQPLATIANYSASVQRRIAQGRLSQAALAQALGDIGAEAERAAQILQGMRALARRRRAQRQPCDPAQVARDAVALFRGLQVGAPEVRLQLEPAAAGLQVLADPLQLQQVLLNLLKNGLDAHRAAGRHAAPLQCRLQAQGGMVCLAVQDSGPPLDAAQRARLFEPFYTTKPDGLGLGLPICRTIVEAHGGALRARPVDPAGMAGGMVFEVWLPQLGHTAPDPGPDPLPATAPAPACPPATPDQRTAP